jgi:hypothetical protein
MPIVAILLAAAAAYYCIVMFPHWFKQGYNENTKAARPVLPMQATSPSTTSIALSQTGQRGYAFEQYIARKFPKRYFKLINCRSDKYVDGIYAISNMDPDLVVEYRSESEIIRFAVECKWRSAFKNGHIEWAKDYQLRNYITFQRRENIPVFVAIGIGGSEENPAEMFILPLQAIRPNWTALRIDFIRQYKRVEPQKLFFLDTQRMILK